MTEANENKALLNYYWRIEKYQAWITDHCPENEEIEMLDLRGSELKGLSDDINKLKNLYILSLDNNELETLPDSFYGLDELEEITLDNNKLKALPNSIFQLQNLKTLSLKGNTELRLDPIYRARVEELNPPADSPYGSSSHMTPEEIDKIFEPILTGGFRKSRRNRKSRNRKSRNRKSRKLSIKRRK
jgi:Leucine-rich repeat (LRR) protein